MTGLMYHFYDSNTLVRTFPLTTSGFDFQMNNTDLVSSVHDIFPVLPL